MDTQKTLSIDDVKKLSETLQEKFKAAHGEDAFMDVYVKKFNERPSMRADNFNRSAHIPLMAYFLSYAIGKPDERFIAAFKVEACKPFGGRKREPTDEELDQIIEDLHTEVDQNFPDRCAA